MRFSRRDDSPREIINRSLSRHEMSCRRCSGSGIVYPFIGTVLGKEGKDCPLCCGTGRRSRRTWRSPIVFSKTDVILRSPVGVRSVSSSSHLTNSKPDLPDLAGNPSVPPSTLYDQHLKSAVAVAKRHGRNMMITVEDSSGSVVDRRSAEELLDDPDISPETLDKVLRAIEDHGKIRRNQLHG